jgi:hypothetical protein
MKKIIILLLAVMLMNESFSQLTNQTTATTTADSEFKSMITFTSSGNIKIPKGVTRIMVEVWGAGGGGSSIGGGGGGSYGKAILQVAEESIVSIVVGEGGGGGDVRGANGGTSAVNYKPASSPASTYVFQAYGGNASVYNNGIALNGSGGFGANSTGVMVGFYSQPGEDGTLYYDNYQQAGANTMVTRNAGNGGCAGNTMYTGGRGEVALNPANPTYVRNGATGKTPGGGGGGGIKRGYQGGHGMVIIHF